MAVYGQALGKTENWETPQYLFDELDAEFHFTLDVAADETNHKCDRYFTKDQDGLKQNWGGDGVVQPTLRKTDFEMGKEGCGIADYCSYASPGTDRYKVVSRIHLRQTRSSFYQRTSAIWWLKNRRTISKYGSCF